MYKNVYIRDVYTNEIIGFFAKELNADTILHILLLFPNSVWSGEKI